MQIPNKFKTSKTLSVSVCSSAFNVPDKFVWKKDEHELVHVYDTYLIFVA